MGNKNAIQKILFYSILVLLFLPMIQEEYHWIRVADLNGYDPIVVEDSVMSKDNWLSGTYQTAKEQYRTRFFGLRNWAIRLNNQWDYAFYNASRVENVVIGKEHYLYGIDYLDAYEGSDFIGAEVIAGKLGRFKRLQDTLAKLGKQLFVVITPNKADLLAEYLPSDITPAPENKTNYAYYVRGLKKRNINYLDINEWFLNLKDKLGYSLFPQTGIHLTHYGSALFADTLISFVEKLIQKDLPEFYWDTILMKSNAEYDDLDAERALNLLFDLPYYSLPYLGNVLIEKEGKYRPTALAVGDSFFWKFIDWNGLAYVFNDGEFWYYNRERHPDKYNVKALNIGEEIKDKEVIFIINSAFKLWRFGFGFDLELYKYFFGSEILKDDKLLELVIQEKMITAKKDKEWMAALQKIAVEKGIAFEEIYKEHVTFVVKKSLGR